MIFKQNTMYYLLIVISTIDTIDPLLSITMVK